MNLLDKPESLYGLTDEEFLEWMAREHLASDLKPTGWEFSVQRMLTILARDLLERRQA